jgi:hypothetical protein
MITQSYHINIIDLSTRTICKCKALRLNVCTAFPLSSHTLPDLPHVLSSLIWQPQNITRELNIINLLFTYLSLFSFHVLCYSPNIPLQTFFPKHLQSTPFCLGNITSSLTTATTTTTVRLVTKLCNKRDLPSAHDLYTS